MIEDIINDITIAKNNKAYLSALSLALTLPNILSNIEHKKSTGKKEYIEWFDKWVYPYYRYPESTNKFINKSIESCKFNGANCYALRCALLHAGNTNLKSNNKKENGIINTFSLCISDISSHCGDSYVCDTSEDFVSNTDVSINIIGLIKALIAGTNDYIYHNKEKVNEYQKTAGYKIIYGHLNLEYI